MNKPGKSSLFKVSLLAALLTSALGAIGAPEARAAGLGKLTVYSAIGQPLNAEVALTATPEELSALSARLASPDDFKKAGVDFMSALTGLRFTVAKLPDGQTVLKLTTDRPLNEPFLHFLVELNWTAGRLVREYTFLLDPPEMLQVARPASVVAPVVPSALPAFMAPAAPAAPVTPVQVEPRPARPAAPSAAAIPITGERQVKLGDTLSKVAREIKPESVSLDQMLVALFNSNRDAFDGNNMNRLRAGKILRLPEPGDAAQVDAGEARKLIIAQAADFNVYRRRLADAAGTAPPDETAPRQQAVGKIKPQVEAKAPLPAAKDKLEVSSSEATKSAKATGATGTTGSLSKAALEEDLIARDKALREAAGRIVDLEKNLENLKQLIELKSQAGAQIQQQAQASLPKPAEAKKPEPTPVAKPVAEPPVQPVAPAPTAEKPVDSTPVAAPVVASPAEPAKPVPAPTESLPPPTPKKPLSPPPPPPPEPSFVDENPEVVYGGGGLIALLLGYLGFSAWRRKKLVRKEAAWHDEPEVSAAGPVAKSAAISESVDSGEVSIQGDFSESGVLTTTESVDPVAEADVYMAYGRDSQAEEILLEGLKTDPTRTAIHLKLLELYANRKSVAEFEAVARELHGLNGGKGSDWDKAAAMAAALGLTGGLFAVAAAGVSATVAPAITGAVETAPVASSPADEEVGSFDFDLDLGTSSGSSAAVEQPTEKPVAEEFMGLDFEFDLGMPTESPPPAEASAPADSHGIDFSADSGIPAGIPVVEPVSIASTTDSYEFDLDLGSTSGALATVDVAEPAAANPDIDLTAEMSAAPAPEPTPARGLSDLDFDFDLELGAEPEPARVDAVALDLGDISLDLNGPDSITPPAGEVSPDEVVLPEMPDVDLPVSGEMPAASPEATSEAAPETVASEVDESEAATKLELALAYEEMGDRDGARELLNEVLNEGNSEQQALARARLDQLDLG